MSSRYEADLWRQVGRILYVLDALDRRKLPRKKTPLPCYCQPPRLTTLSLESLSGFVAR